MKSRQMTRHCGVWRIRLRGTRDEMWEQYGELVRDYVGSTALQYFRTKLKKSLRHTPLMRRFPFLATPARMAIHQFLHRPLIQRLPADHRRALTAFARGSKVPVTDLLRSYVIPDIGQWIFALGHGRSKLSEGFFKTMPAPSLGCSTAIFPPNTDRTHLLHARNLDYQGFGIFDADPAVIYFYPTGENEMPYASFISLGLPTAGITAYNQAGLFLSLHQLMTNDVSLKGTPILSVTEKVVREALSLDQALELLRNHRYTSSWKVILSSHHENQSLMAEVSSSGVNHRFIKEEDFLTTNHVELLPQDREFSTSYLYVLDSRARARSLRHMMEQKPIRHERHAASLIGSSHFYDPQPKKRAAVGIPAKVNNVQSVVAIPGRKVAYMALPGQPYETPVSGSYVPVSLDFEAVGAAEDLTTLETGESFNGSDRLAPPERQAQALYRRAAQLVEDQGDDEGAVTLLEEAYQLDQDEASYPLVAAWISFRLAGFSRRGAARPHLDHAERHLRKAKSRTLNSYQDTMIHFFQGRYFDCVGDRPQALAHYRRVDPRHHQGLTAQLKRHLKRPAQLTDLRKIMIDLEIFDLYSF